MGRLIYRIIAVFRAHFFRWTRFDCWGHFFIPPKEKIFLSRDERRIKKKAISSSSSSSSWRKKKKFIAARRESLYKFSNNNNNNNPPFFFYLCVYLYHFFFFLFFSLTSDDFVRVLEEEEVKKTVRRAIYDIWIQTFSFYLISFYSFFLSGWWFFFFLTRWAENTHILPSMSIKKKNSGARINYDAKNKIYSCDVIFESKIFVFSLPK